MSFVEKVLSGKYPHIEKLFQKEFGKVVDEVFGSLDFEELDESEPAKPETVIDPLERERRRYEALKRELDVVKLEKATLQAKLDAARHELST